MYPVSDNDELKSKMKTGFVRPFCTDEAPLLRNHMKALTYAKMFEMNESDLKGPIPIDAITFAQATLQSAVKDKSTIQNLGLVFVIWTLVGRAVLTYLFQLVHTDVE